MSMENMENSSPWPAEDLEIANMIINESPLLNKDPYTQRVLATGKFDNGEEVVLGNFLTAREAILKKWQAEAQIAAAERKDRKAYDAAVINSERPDLEVE